MQWRAASCIACKIQTNPVWTSFFSLHMNLFSIVFCFLTYNCIDSLYVTEALFLPNSACKKCGKIFVMELKSMDKVD